MRTDTERMDWLQEQAAEVVAMTNSRGGIAWWRMTWLAEDDEPSLDSRDLPRDQWADLRAAIDAAMDAEAEDRGRGEEG